MTGLSAGLFYSTPQRKQFRSLVTPLTIILKKMDMEDTEGNVILPQVQARDLLTQMHQWTHLGAKKLVQAVKGSRVFIINLAEEIVKRCQVCQQMNACHTKVEKGKRPRGSKPGVFWEIDFTENKPGKYGYKYLLVFVDTFSGWVEAFLTKWKTTMVFRY